MKLLKILFIAVFALSVTACGNDDDSTTAVDTSQLLATWSMTDLDYTGDSETQAAGQTIESSFVGEGTDIDLTMTFTEDPNNVTSEGSYGIELTTTTGGQSITQQVGSEVIGGAIQDNNTTTWSISGNELTFSANGETGIYTIVQLSATTLVLNLNQSVEFSEGGVTQTSNLDVTYSFTK